MSLSTNTKDYPELSVNEKIAYQGRTEELVEFVKALSPDSSGGTSQLKCWLQIQRMSHSVA